MKRRGLLGAFGGLALCPLCARPSAAADWAWSGDKGPEHWGTLPNFGTCGTGSQQSPIDLTGAITAHLSPLGVAWTRVDAKIVNPGYTIRVNIPDGNLLRVGRNLYEMIEFHFHAPSEHAVGGKRQAMEVHFVHKRGTAGNFGADPVDGANDWEETPIAATSAFGVVGVLIKPGAANATFAEIARLMPQAMGDEAPISLSPSGLLPMSRRYFYYEGSLTTPGCSEVVSWVVMRDPITAAPADIARFTALYPQSARPLQPRNRRLLLES